MAIKRCKWCNPPHIVGPNGENLPIPEDAPALSFTDTICPIAQAKLVEDNPDLKPVLDDLNRRKSMFELIFNKQAFSAIKEKLNKSQYIEEGPKQQMNPAKGPAKDPAGSHKADTAIGQDFIEPGEVSKLEFPKVKKESSVSDKAQEFISDKIRILKEEGKDEDQAAAMAYSMAREKGFDVPEKKSSKESAMNKESAQKLPGSEKINAADPISEGEKGKLEFPTKAAPAPKGSLPASSEAQSQIDKGDKGGIKHGPAGGKAIKIDWNVVSDSAIGGNFMEAGEKGDIKKVKGPAKEPGVSQQKLPGADSAMGDHEVTKPIQKQFSVSWKRYSSEERKEIIDSAIDCAISDLEVMASKLGVKIWETPLADAYGTLITARNSFNRQGAIILKASDVAKDTLKSKYGGDNFDMGKCVSEEKNEDLCKWLSASKSPVASPAPAPLKATASKKISEAEDLKAVEETGKKIF